MCDVAYVLLVERLTQQTLADRHIVAVFRAAGVKGVDMPDVESALAAFDVALNEVPRFVTPNERMLRSALRLSHAG